MSQNPIFTEKPSQLLRATQVFIRGLSRTTIRGLPRTAIRGPATVSTGPQLHARLGIVRWLSFAVSLGLPAVLAADEIHADRVYRGVIVRKFDGEFLIFEGPSASTARRLQDIRAIFVDSVPGLEAFNRAEGLYQRGSYTEAAAQYDASLRQARGFWKQIIEARTIMACDQAGLLRQATELFLRLGALLPDKAAELRPRQVDRASAEEQRAALLLVERAIPGATDRQWGWELEVLRLALAERLDLPRAEELAVEALDRLSREPGGLPRWPVRIAALRVLARTERWPAVLPAVEAGLAEADEHLLPELLNLKGRALLGTAATRDDHLAGALAHMRVVVHFPDSPFCAESLYQAAWAHEQIGRPSQAAALYKECAERANVEPELRSRAAAAAARLGGPQGK